MKPEYAQIDFCLDLSGTSKNYQISIPLWQRKSGSPVNGLKSFLEANEKNSEESELYPLLRKKPVEPSLLWFSLCRGQIVSSFASHPPDSMRTRALRFPLTAVTVFASVFREGAKSKCPYVVVRFCHCNKLPERTELTKKRRSTSAPSPRVFSPYLTVAFALGVAKRQHTTALWRAGSGQNCYPNSQDIQRVRRG